MIYKLYKLFQKKKKKKKKKIRTYCLNLISGRFTVTLIWVSGHPELARAGTLFRNPLQSIRECHLISYKLAIARKFSRDVNLFWISVGSCSTAKLTWPSMDRRHTTSYFNLVVTLSRSQWSCLQVTVL